jgi:hypothetical protein
MNKILILLVATAIISGCDLRVLSYEIDGYEEACSSNGGLYSINNMVSSALCNDGKVVRWYKK